MHQPGHGLGDMLRHQMPFAESSELSYGADDMSGGMGMDQMPGSEGPPGQPGQSGVSGLSDMMAGHPGNRVRGFFNANRQNANLASQYERMTPEAQRAYNRAAFGGTPGTPGGSTQSYPLWEAYLGSTPEEKDQARRAWSGQRAGAPDGARDIAASRTPAQSAQLASLRKSEAKMVDSLEGLSGPAAQRMMAQLAEVRKQIRELESQGTQGTGQ